MTNGDLDKIQTIILIQSCEQNKNNIHEHANKTLEKISENLFLGGVDPDFWTKAMDMVNKHEKQKPQTQTLQRTGSGRSL